MRLPCRNPPHVTDESIKATDIIEKVDSFNRIKARDKSFVRPWTGTLAVVQHDIAARSRAREQRKKEKRKRVGRWRNGTRNSALRWSREFVHWISRTKSHDSQKRATPDETEAWNHLVGWSVGRLLALSRSTSHEPEVTVYVFSMVYNSFDSCLVRILHTTS